MKNSWYKIFGFAFLATLVLSACNLEQEVELDLPDYEGQVVVEAYLEPGKPFRALITESAPYFESFPTETGQFLENILLEGATVSISYNDETVLLNNGLFFDFETGKLYNYQANQVVPADYQSVFELDILTEAGTTITGVTRILPPVGLDSVAVQFNDTDTLARVVTYFSDEPAEANFYRAMLHLNSLDSLPYQSFILNDEFVENGTVAFGTFFDFNLGDTIINTLFHIDEAYYRWLQSVALASASNGNPFGQPGTLQSNLEGSEEALGIFTGLSYVRDTVIVDK
jgi:hypothetical protein